MISAYDKAIVPIAASILAWINQRYGYHFNVDAETLTAFVGAISTIVVYFTPNRPA